MKKTLELVCQADLKAWDLQDNAESTLVFIAGKGYHGLIMDDYTVVAVGEDSLPYTVTQGDRACGAPEISGFKEALLA